MSDALKEYLRVRRMKMMEARADRAWQLLQIKACPDCGKVHPPMPEGWAPASHYASGDGGDLLSKVLRSLGAVELEIKQADDDEPTPPKRDLN